MSVFKKLKNSYIFFAVSVISTLMLFVLLNFISYFILKQKHENNNNDIIYKVICYNAYLSDDTGLGIDSAYVNDVLGNYMQFLKTGENEFEYYPATEYQHRAIDLGSYKIVNNENDFNTRPKIDPQNCNNKFSVYCFGGSTTLGILNANEHTWPAFLAQKLNNNTLTECYDVTNYGTGSFGPTQETNQFIELLKLGHRPSLVIFMDGTNFGAPFDASEFSSKISHRFNYNGIKLSDYSKFISLFPLIKLIKKESIFEETDFSNDDEEFDMLDINYTSDYNDLIVNRFIENARIRKSIAELYGVHIIQILQPNPYFEYNNEFFSETVQKWMSGGTMAKKNYQYIYDKIIDSKIGFTDFSGLLTQYNKPAIIDLVHYSPGFNKFLAGELAEQIDTIQGLKPNRFEKDAATGIFFKPNQVKNF